SHPRPRPPRPREAPAAPAAPAGTDLSARPLRPRNSPLFAARASRPRSDRAAQPCDPGTRANGTWRGRPARASGFDPSALEQDPPQLVGLAGLEDGEHLVAHLERRVAVRDLRLAVPDDGDQLRPGRERDAVHRLADAGRV